MNRRRRYVRAGAIGISATAVFTYVCGTDAGVASQASDSARQALVEAKPAVQVMEKHAGRSWQQVTTPQPGATADRVVWDVAAVSRGEAWAVGSYGHYSPLILQYENDTWTMSAPPSTSGGQGELYAMSASGPSNIWASGVRGPSGKPWIIHYDGATWSTVELQGLARGFYPFGISTRSDDDVWAAGTSGRGHPAVAHWNGTRWSTWIAPVRRPFTNGGMWDVAVVPHSSQVVAGGYLNKNGPLKPLVAIYKDGSWHVLKSPKVALGEVRSVAAAGRGDVWLAGERTTTSFVNHPLIEHYNGKSIKIMDLPSVPGTSYLYSIDGGRRNVFGVGAYERCPTPRSCYERAVTIRKAGAKWRLEASANPKAQQKTASLRGVAAIPGTGGFWAGGTIGDRNRQTQNGANTLIEKWAP